MAKESEAYIVVTVGGPTPGMHFSSDCLPGIIRTNTGGVYHRTGQEVYYNYEDPSKKLYIGRYTFRQEALRAKA